MLTIDSFHYSFLSCLILILYCRLLWVVSSKFTQGKSKGRFLCTVQIDIYLHTVEKVWWILLVGNVAEGSMKYYLGEWGNAWVVRDKLWSNNIPYSSSSSKGSRGNTPQGHPHIIWHFHYRCFIFTRFRP